MTVELLNLAFYAYHGLYDFERDRGGEFMVDVKIDAADLASYTDLNHVLNYEDIYRIVHHRMQVPLDFIEEVARLILEDLKESFPTSLFIEVKLTKCAPPIPGMNGSARVTAVFKK